jgi:hypothetical protein
MEATMLRIAIALTLMAIALPAAAQDRFKPVTKLGIHKAETPPKSVAPLTKGNTQLNQINNTNAQSMNQTMRALQVKAQADRQASKANAAQMKNSSLGAKQTAIAKQQQAIRNGMQEAQQKADRSMNAANQSLVSGIAGGAASAAGINTPIGAQTMGGQSISSAVGKYNAGQSQTSNLKIDAKSPSQKAKIQANQLQAKTVAAQQRSDKADEARKSSQDHARQAKDNIKKLLDQRREMRPCALC